jgi:hypothetical protein
LASPQRQLTFRSESPNRAAFRASHRRLVRFIVFIHVALSRRAFVLLLGHRTNLCSTTRLASGGHFVSNSRNPHLVTTAKCAAPGCANVHREANHWFVISVEQRFTCRPYFAAARLRPLDQPACGQACAQKLFERYLAKQAV